MDQTMLLAVTLGGDQNSFTVLVFDASQLHTQVANEIRAFEDVPHLVFQKFIHGDSKQQAAEFPKSAGRKSLRRPNAAGSLQR